MGEEALLNKWKMFVVYEKHLGTHIGVKEPQGVMLWAKAQYSCKKKWYCDTEEKMEHN